MSLSAVQMVVTGLTKMKMGDTFSDMLNVTLATRYTRHIRSH